MVWVKKDKSKSICPPHNYEIISVSRGSGEKMWSMVVDADRNSEMHYWTEETVVLKKRCAYCGDTYTTEERGSPEDYKRK